MRALILQLSIVKSLARSTDGGMSVYGAKMMQVGNFSIKYSAESNAATILPGLLDRLIALGERARQTSHALDNSGHRPEVAAALIGYLKHQAHK